MSTRVVGGRLQLTLALFKPDISLNPRAVTEMKNIMKDNQFEFVRSKTIKMTMNQAKEFYKVHEKRFFYNRLVFSMSSGPIHCHILAKENCIADWRRLMGNTKVFKTIYEQPESLRGMFGLTDTRNTVHGSDSDQNAELEIKYFFPEFDLNEWQRH